MKVDCLPKFSVLKFIFQRASCYSGMQEAIFFDGSSLSWEFLL